MCHASTFDGDTAVSLTGTKNMDVADGFTYTLQNNSFFFTVLAQGDAPSVTSPVGNTDSSQVQDSNDWTSSMTLLNNLTFSMSDMDGASEKTFYYIITEQIPQLGAPGVTYDETAYQVAITVTDDGEGALSASDPVIQKGGWDGTTFTFTLTADDEATQTAIDNGTVTLPDNTGGISIGYEENDNTDTKTGAFGDITFTAAGDYVFNITEVVPDDATNSAVTDADGNSIAYEDATDEQKAQSGWTLNGVTYDNPPHSVTVQVRDNNNDGILTIEVTGNTANPTVTNTYQPGGDVTLAAGSFNLTKVLTGKDWDGDTFTFTLSGVTAKTPEGADIDPIPMPTDDADGDGNPATATVSAATGETQDGNDSATFSFGSITYDTIGTYTYQVVENEGSNPGMEYSDVIAEIVVTVTDNLNVAVTSQQNTTFTNTYGTELEYNTAGGLAIVKNLTGADLTSSNPFSFTVRPVASADGSTTAAEAAQQLGISESGQTFTTRGNATMDDDGISHESVSVVDATAERNFTQTDEGKTYTYTVSETNDGSYNQTFVYDNDEATEDQEAIIPFNNTYNATGGLGGNGFKWRRH